VSETNHRKLGSIGILAAGATFGTTGTLQTKLAPQISGITIASTRLFIGAITLILIAYFSRKSYRPAPQIKMPRIDLWLSGVGIAIYQVSFFSSVKLTGVPIATLTALGTSPIFTGLVAYFLVGEKPSRVWFRATVLTTIGITLLNMHPNEKGFNFLGVLLAAIAGLGFAVFNVSSRRALNSGVLPTQLAAWVFSLAAILLFPFCFANGISWLLSPKGAVLVLWLGVVTTGLGYTLYSYGLKRVHSSTASTLVLAEPATATLLAVLVLGSVLTLNSWLGIATVITGLLYLAIRG
jgi:DME family drug/metabolite transporter